ncbi:MAG: DUF5682 family protein, partial [Actinomycetia bacterium]|nr:DUF5682 family protein [Actinomycetes bacterium]
MAPVSYFGIRHHGPGSAAALVAALDELRPRRVLIEGPSDATAILPLLADPAMKPPVALLAYPAGDPSRTAFWPFAEYSPEYQATCWAVRHGVPVEFIDLPSVAQVESRTPDEPGDAPTPGDEDTPSSTAGDTSSPAVAQRTLRHTDPIGELAAAAGYEDGESWWADLVEQNP